MFKSFLLYGGTDEDRVILATLIRLMYGVRVPASRKIGPEVDELAVMSEVTVRWVPESDGKSHRNEWTGEPGSGSDFRG